MLPLDLFCSVRSEPLENSLCSFGAWYTAKNVEEVCPRRQDFPTDYIATCMTVLPNDEIRSLLFWVGDLMEEKGKLEITPNELSEEIHRRLK